MAALTASALVTDENPHAEFFFNPTVDRRNGQGVRATGVRIANAAGSLYSIRPLTGSEKLCQTRNANSIFSWP
jgi:hypothetical protein